MMSENIIITANKCMDAVIENVGTVELEQFIYYIRSQAFDYTKWQREHYDKISPDEQFKSLQEYSEKHSFDGEKAVTI